MLVNMGRESNQVLKNLIWLMVVLLWTGNDLVLKGVQGADKSRSRPEFLGPVPNATVAVGRDVVLPCVVKNLQDYKVAFIHLDRQMIVTIHNHVITRIPRFEISHDKHHTWNLHIKNVQKEDKGHYMCQINTDPMLSNVGHLNVVVPPNIVDLESSPSTVSVRENHNASLVCKAEGTPDPSIKWQREDKKPIIIKRKKKEGKKEKHEVHGEVLDLIRISRTEMGAYLCIAQNGVPPSISKRIILTVEFSPMIWIPNQLVGAPLGTTVKLECHTESSPKAISYWAYNDSMVLTSERFKTEERHHSVYKLDSTLIIKNLRRQDFGSYRCISKNSLGETDGAIMLYELEAPTKETKVTTVTYVPEYESFYDYNTHTSNHDRQSNVIRPTHEGQPGSDHSNELQNLQTYENPSKYNKKLDSDQTPTFWHRASDAPTHPSQWLVVDLLAFLTLVPHASVIF